MEDGFIDCLLLKKLLYPDKNSSDSDSEDGICNSSHSKRKNPSLELNEPKSEKKYSSNKTKNKKEPEDVEEFEEYTVLNSKNRPEFTLVYKQYLATEDVYLQIDPTFSTFPKEIIIKISLPDETTTADMMDLSITELEVVLNTAVYYLKLPLPYQVNVDESVAKYDAENKVLNLTLKTMTLSSCT